MADRGNESQEQSIGVSVPIAAIAAGAVVALGVASYLLSNRGQEGTTGTASNVARSGRKAGRRLGLNALIALLENDATRRVVLALLKAMARRA
jgi:hypothetical protein